MRFSYHTEQWLPCPVDALFDFFACPDNLPLLMPAWQKARIEAVSIIPPQARPATTSSPVVAAGVGSRIALTFRPFPYSPVRVSWHAEIVEFAWNDHFCDRQIRGPFAYWNHCHRVQPEPRSATAGTLIADRVEYELPFGFAGELAHRIFLRRQIERTFAYRQSQLAILLARVKSRSSPSQPG